MTFSAAVKYNDYQGTVALDRSDSRSLSDRLKDLELIQNDELVVAVRLNIGENHGDEIETIGVVAYVHTADRFVPAPETLRSVETDMRFSEFFSYFKRFDLVIVLGDRDLSKTIVE